MEDKIKKNLFAIITISLSVGILLFFMLQPQNIFSLKKITSHLHPAWTILTLTTVGAGWLLESLALHVYCRHMKAKWSIGRSFVIAMSGLLYSAVTPFGAGGQPMQIYSMHKMGMDTGKAGSAIAMKTLTYQVVMVIYAMVMVVSQLSYFQSSVSQFSFLTVVGLASNTAFITAVFLFMASSKTTDRILRFVIRLLYRVQICRRPVVRYQKIHHEFVLFHNSARLMGRSVRLYARAIFLTVLQITTGSLVPYFILRSFGLSGPWFIMAAAQVFVTMVSAFVPLPGAAEGSFGLFFRGFFEDTTIAAVFIWRFLTYYVHILIGCVVSSAGGKIYFIFNIPEKSRNSLKEREA